LITLTYDVIVIGGGGRVCGVRCIHGREFRASGGVVLAAGDFTNSPELKARFMGPQEAKLEGVNVTATGDGRLMAEKLGARILNGNLALGPEIRFIPPARDTVVRLLPPWPALAVFMQWARDLAYPPMPIAKAPFTALGPVRAVFVHNEGGISVDTEHRVLDQDAKPIPGLYAAGSTGQGGLLLKGHGHHLAWAFVSGRRAGRFAAFNAVSEDLH
jgi:FAD binding domain